MNSNQRSNTSLNSRNNKVSIQIPKNTSSSSRSTIKSLFPTNKSQNSTLTTIEERNELIKLKPNFKLFLNLISEFINHNNSTKNIINLIQKHYIEIDKCFTNFFTHFSKSGGISLQISKGKNFSMYPTVKAAAIPFLRNWVLFTLSLNDIIENGLIIIQNSIENNFSNILLTLESVQKGKGYNSGIHDPIKLLPFHLLYNFQIINYLIELNLI